MLWRCACRLSLKTLGWVVSGVEGLFRTTSRALVTHALLEALLAGCRVTAAAHALAVPLIALEHAALVASLHERLRSNLGACVCERLCLLLHARVERSTAESTESTERLGDKSAANLLQVLVSLYLLKVRTLVRHASYWMFSNLLVRLVAHVLLLPFS